ncbi:hypothetical protein GCM10022261_19950 [Brevibacterium daeguense]|uniref:Gas vesicle protein n=1 Tax=Brevibacterium daeguense TaxID=909936 RepID=A0ABP8EKH0_9MICO|nr:gas vesicle protein [Brevibacterium daeguense]
MTVARNVPGSGMEPQRDRDGTLIHVVETLLDKGLVLNADIMVSVAGVELLGIRIRAALASFETAAKYGLEFPAGTNTDTVAWRNAVETKETCPSCGKKVVESRLLNEMCPWCGWQSAQALRAQESQDQSEGELGRARSVPSDSSEQANPNSRSETDSSTSEPVEEPADDQRAAEGRS